jgi:hypothetical protein
LATTLAGALTVLAVGFTVALATGFVAGFGAGLATAFGLVFVTGFVGPLGIAFVAGFAAALVKGLVAGLDAGLLTTLGAGFAGVLGVALAAALLTTGLPLVTALGGAALAGAGLEAFLAGAVTFAFELLAALFFFTAVFELVLRGFFTSCLLAVAAYAPLKAPAIGK